MIYIDILQKLSKKGAIKLAKNVSEHQFHSLQDQIDAYTYGIQVILGMLLKFSLLILLGLILNILFPALVLMLTFSSFRVLCAGGYHSKSFKACLIQSLAQFSINALIAEIYYNNIPTIPLVIITITIGIYITIRYVPRDNPNRIINKKEDIKRFKITAFIYLAVWAIIMFISLIPNYKLFIVASSFGLLLELYSVSKIGYIFFTKLKINK